MSPQKAGLVLRHVLAGAGSQHRDLLLDFLDVIFARFEVDLVRRVVALARVSRFFSRQPECSLRTCLTATISPVAFSIALYTVPKLPPAENKESLVNNIDVNCVAIGARLTPQLLHHLVMTGHVVRHGFRGMEFCCSSGAEEHREKTKNKKENGRKATQIPELGTRSLSSSETTLR